MANSGKNTFLLIPCKYPSTLSEHLIKTRFVNCGDYRIHERFFKLGNPRPRGTGNRKIAGALLYFSKLVYPLAVLFRVARHIYIVAFRVTIRIKIAILPNPPCLPGDFNLKYPFH